VIMLPARGRITVTSKKFVWGSFVCFLFFDVENLHGKAREWLCEFVF